MLRLGKTDIGATPIAPEEMLPAVCQGIVGVERRAGDDRISALLQPLNNRDASHHAAAERSLLAGLDGSCRTPIAALATIKGADIHLRAAIIRPDGSELLETKRHGPVADASRLGDDAADELRRRGGRGFFDE